MILLPKSPRPWLSLSIYDQDQYQAEENFLTQVRKTEFLTYKSPFQNCCMSSIDCLDLFWQSKWYRYKLVSLYCTCIQHTSVHNTPKSRNQISNIKWQTNPDNIVSYNELLLSHLDNPFNPFVKNNRISKIKPNISYLSTLRIFVSDAL